MAVPTSQAQEVGSAGVNGSNVNYEAGVRAPANMNQDYNPHALVGSLIDDEEEPVPLLYFNSVPEAWVRSLG